MVALRSRPVVSIATGMILALALVWSLSAWRASAMPSDDESTVVAITPVRILDTREQVGVGLTGRFVSATPRDLQVTGSIPTTTGNQVVVPDGSTGVLLNVTVVTPTADGFISVRPADAAGPPATSSLNFLAGDIAPNSVQVSMPTAGPDAGKIEITYDAYGQVGPETDVLVDVVAYTTNAGIQSLVAALNTKADLPTVQLLTYDDGPASRANTPTDPHVRLRDLGTFTKSSPDTFVRLTWQSHVRRTGGTWCTFQVRVNDVNADGGVGRVGTQSVVYSDQSAPVPVSQVTVWDGLAAGNHDISIWVRGSGNPTCADTHAGGLASVLIEEFSADGSVTTASVADDAPLGDSP